MEFPGSPRRRLGGLLLALALLAGAVACTPRPEDGRDVLERFLTALAAADIPGAAELTDRPEAAEEDLGLAWRALDASYLEHGIARIGGDGAQSTAEVDLDWALGGDRRWRYRTTMALARVRGQWLLRWQPSALHPRLGANQHPALRTLPADRATVVGSDGAELLRPGTVHRVILDRDVADSAQGAVNRIATVVNNGFAADPEGPRVDARAVGAAAAGGDGPFSVIVLPGDAPGRIREQLAEIPGVRVNDEAAMVRPDPGFAPELMSRVEDLVAEGPAGVDGWAVVAASPDGATVSELHRVAPRAAEAVRASIDKSVQDAAQAAVDTRADAETMLVAIRPSTGEVLAVAQTRKADERGDLALTGQFPPGSTFKIITAGAGIALAGLEPGATVPCPGTMEIGNRVVTNYNGSGVGDTSLDAAFARSCNTTFGNIAHSLAPGQLKEQAAAFGLGVDYRIPGLTTFTGSVSEGADEAERTDAGYGQGLDLASPFGMALVSATVARGGTPAPTLLPAAGTWSSRASRPLDPAVLAGLRSMMRSVVTSGTATAIAGRGEVRGKTGEAEAPGGSHAWFTGYRGDLAFATLIVHGGGSEHAVAVTDRFLELVDEAAELTPAP